MDIAHKFMVAIEQIRTQIEGEIFDYSQLMFALSTYSKPKDVVTKLISQGRIIRIKKGLYVFGDLWRRNVVEPVSLAGLVYGPSAISLDYALAWHGLIPERVSTITSVTTGRSRSFSTPLGEFTYVHLSIVKFAFGLVRHDSPTGGMMMAEPLKALVDKVWTDKRCKPVSSSYFADYLFADLRVDEESLQNILDPSEMNTVESAYRSRKISLLLMFLKKRYRQTLNPHF